MILANESNVVLDVERLGRRRRECGPGTTDQNEGEKRPKKMGHRFLLAKHASIRTAGIAEPRVTRKREVDYERGGGVVGAGAKFRITNAGTGSEALARKMGLHCEESRTSTPKWQAQGQTAGPDSGDESRESDVDQQESAVWLPSRARSSGHGCAEATIAQARMTTSHGTSRARARRQAGMEMEATTGG